MCEGKTDPASGGAVRANGGIATHQNLERESGVIPAGESMRSF